MKGFLLYSFGLLFLARATFGAPASGELSQIYRTETESVIRRLAELGITEISCMAAEGDNRWDCLSPADLMRGLQRARFVELEEMRKPEGATRWSAFYAPGLQTIFLNKMGFHQFANAGFLGLHELLGLMGRGEHGFEVSVAALNLLCLEKEISRRPEKRLHVVRDWLKGALSRKSVQLSESGRTWENDTLWLAAEGGGGGATIVGGAGDSRSLALRADIFLLPFHFGVDGSRIKEILLQFHDLPVEFTRGRAEEISYEIKDGKLKRVLVPLIGLFRPSRRYPGHSFAAEDIFRVVQELAAGARIRR